MTTRAAGLTRRVQLDAPVERAFAAVGTLAGVRGWWTPLVSGSTKEGGLLTLRFRGIDETIRFRVEACKAPSGARWVCLGHDSLEDWSGTHLSFTVRARADGSSELELRHVGLVPALECYASCRAGWEHFIRSLVAWVETGRGQPFGAEKRSERPRKPPRRKVTRAAAQAPAVHEPLDGENAFAGLVRTFAGDRRITLPEAKRGKFGSNGLKVDGKIFAMWVRGALVVKLPQREVDDAVAAARGERLSMGRRHVMKEWLVVREDQRRWPAIVCRARQFVARET